MKQLIFSSLLLLMFACEKTTDKPKSGGCDADIVAQLNFVPFTGEIDFTGCVFYLNKYRFQDGNFYYVPDCNCCDMALQVINCAGENTCDADGLCPGFSEAELIGVVGIEP